MDNDLIIAGCNLLAAYLLLNCYSFLALNHSRSPSERKIVSLLNAIMSFLLVIIGSFGVLHHYVMENWFSLSSAIALMATGVFLFACLIKSCLKRNMPFKSFSDEEISTLNNILANDITPSKYEQSLLLRLTALCAINELYDHSKNDVVNTFNIAELYEITKNLEHFKKNKLENIYHKALYGKNSSS